MPSYAFGNPAETCFYPSLQKPSSNQAGKSGSSPLKMWRRELRGLKHLIHHMLDGYLSGDLLIKLYRILIPELAIPLHDANRVFESALQKGLLSDKVMWCWRFS